MTYTTEIHLRERTDGFFDGWLTGAQNFYPTMTIMCAMDSARAERWASDVERIAASLTGKLVDYQGNPTGNRVETIKIYENLAAA